MSAFPEPPAGYTWHNPEGLTPEQVQTEKDWRLCLTEELCGVVQDGFESAAARWTPCRMSNASTFKGMRGTYRTRAPLPAPKVAPELEALQRERDQLARMGEKAREQLAKARAGEDALRDVIKGLEKDLKQAREEPVDPNPWVSVAERLPEEGDAYMGGVLWYGYSGTPSYIFTGLWNANFEATHWKRLIPPVISKPEDQNRKDFETWAVTAGYFVHKDASGKYPNSHTKAAWETWRAARAAKGGES